ncbi:ArdC family protein [Bryobacter aggregatus]|uniref:ArdC family protein n=1 Tax=Bryobacter aggregatus TaxID=360054 RepID=UPI0004E0C4B9|nr:zincin-like metallopeptidase domain-containing protein [Bryobacter aggregatus]
MPNDPTSEAVPTKRDFRKEVTDRIIEMLEHGTAPWQKPWEPGSLQLPFNPTTDKGYRGGNAIHLMAVGTSKGFDDPRWLTYKQAAANGWQVRAGEKGTQIEFWQFSEDARKTQSTDKNPKFEASTNEYQAPLRKVFTVFNASQIDGMEPYLPKTRSDWEIAESGDSILKNSGARISHDQNDRAFYSRSQDRIHLPPVLSFRTAADYYGTALHELAHWSGHPDRLNRPTLNESYNFGDLNYAKEELRAELTSVFLAAERGIPHNPEQHAAYVQSWIKALSDDKNEIFRAAKDAHRAADYILDLERGKQLRTETSEHVASFERSAGAVAITEKETATEHRDPVASKGAARIETEKILDGEVEGRRPPSEQALKQSLHSAKAAVKELMGENTKTYPADTDSGKYRGVVLAETEHHVIQQVSAKSAVAHEKHLLPEIPQATNNILISYSNQIAQLKPNQERQRSHSLSR